MNTVLSELDVLIPQLACALRSAQETAGLDILPQLLHRACLQSHLRDKVLEVPIALAK